jgi:nicotinamide-nucleotide amidase
LSTRAQVKVPTYDVEMTSSHELAEGVAEMAQNRGVSVGAVESLTGGVLSSALATEPGAADWFRGSVVTYSPRVKQPDTVWVGLVVDGTPRCERFELDGSPPEIIERANEEPVRLLLSALEE